VKAKDSGWFSARRRTDMGSALWCHGHGSGVTH
jgi:hypothetical protein